MKERISCIGKIHKPHKIQGPQKNAPFRFAGAAKAFKPCSLEQLLCDKHHRGCAEQVTAWGYSPKYKHASRMTKTVTGLHHMELLQEEADLS